MEERRIVRTFLIGFPLLLACLFLIALGVLNTQAFRNFLRSEITRQALQLAGVQVEVGSLRTHWMRLGLDLNDLVVYGTAGPSSKEPPLLRVARLQVGVRFLPLLHKRLQFRGLILERPVVHLTIDSQGRSNLPVAPQPSSSGNSSAETLFDLAIADCSIRSGEIYYNDAEIPLDAEAHDLKFDARYSLLRREYKGSLSYDNGRLTTQRYGPIMHGMKAQFTANREGLSLVPLLISSGSSTFELDARMTNYASPNVSGSYESTISTGELANLFRSQSLPMGAVALNGEIDYVSGQPGTFLAGLHLQGKANSSKLEVPTGQQPIAATSVSANYELKGTTLRIDNVAASILGGRAEGMFEIQQMDSPHSRSRLEATVKGVSLMTASDVLAPRNVQRIGFAGITDLDLKAEWSGAWQNALGHARLAISSRQPEISAQTIPVNGIVQVDYDGPRNTVAFGQSNLQTAHTKLSISGSLSSHRGGNSAINVVLATTDLRETSTLVRMVQTALSPRRTDASVLSVSGEATLNAHVTGTARDPRIQGHLGAQNLTIASSQWRSLTLDLNANSSQAVIQNGVLVGKHGERINLSGKTGLQDWSIEPSSPVALQAAMSGVPVATVEEIVQPHYPVEGVLNANVALSGTRGAPEGKATLTLGKGTAWNESFDSLTANVDAHQGAVQSTMQLRIPAGVVSADANYKLATEEYEVNLHGSGLQLDKIATLQKEASVQGKADLSVTANGSIHNPKVHASLTSAQLEMRGQAISNFTAQVDVASQHATLQLHSVVAQGSVEAKGDVALTGERFTTATVDVRALPVAALAEFFPIRASKIAGQTEIHLTLRGPLATPSRMEAHLEIPTFSVNYGKAQMALARPLLADYRGGTLTISPTQIRGSGTDLTFGGTVPIRSGAAYSLVADGSMDLNVLQQFAPGLRSSGQMEIHVHSSSGSSAPSMQGQFQIKNAVLTTDSSPVGIEGLNAQINLNGARAEIANFSGTAGGGTVSARGAIDFGKQTNFNLALNAQSVRVRYPTGLRTVLSGQINAQGNPSASSLTGRVVVDNISFTQDFDLATFVSSFSSDSIGGTAPAFERNMSLSIAVQSSQNVALATSKVSLSGAANLNLTGTIADPIVLGRISLTSGDVFFLSKRFQVQSGTIAFANPARTEPVLNMYVNTTVEQYSITLNLTGPVDRLRTNYTSDPSLPPADIIHLLAFGNTNEESASAPSQSTATSAESLLAQGVSGKVAGKLENLTGLSQLTIDPLAANAQGNPGAEVAIQERVTGSLLFTFSTNVTDTQSQTVQLQYDLNRRVSVTVLRDQNGGYGVDVRLHKTF